MRRFLAICGATLALLVVLTGGVRPVAAETILGPAIPVGMFPFAIAANPVTNRVYVANLFDDSLSVIDGNTNLLVTTLALGSTANSLAVNPATNRFYVVTGLLTGEVLVFDGLDNTQIDTITVGSTPRGIGINTATNQLYVANAGDDTISVIDGTTNTVTTTVTVGDAPRGVAVNEVTQRIYVANEDAGTVTVIDGTTNTVVGSPIAVGAAPNFLAIHPATNQIYVTNADDDTVSVIAGGDNTVVATIPVGDGPDGIGLNPVTNRLYVANADANSVAVIDAVTNTVVGTIQPTGDLPTGIAVNPALNRVYVSQFFADSVLVLGGAASASIGASDATATFGAASVTLSAAVLADAIPVNEGTVTFTVRNASAAVVGSILGVPVAGGAASGVLPLTGLPAGSYTISAAYAANANFTGASDPTPATLTIGRAAQTITFEPLTDRPADDPAFAVSATASSGLPVTFQAAGPCSIAGTTVTLAGIGTCAITATQAGDADYQPAALTRTFRVTAVPTTERFTLTLTASAGGSAQATPAPVGGTYSGGTELTLTATADPGFVFTGFLIDGVDAGLTNPLTLTIVANRSARAIFVPRPAFSDVAQNDPDYELISQLAGRWIIRGFSPEDCQARGLAAPCFGPALPVARAQAAALIIRAIGRDNENWGERFSDTGDVDLNLQRNINTLAHYGIARGFGDNTFQPFAPVARVQTIAFITRAMVSEGLWFYQADTGSGPNCAANSNVPRSSGHCEDLATYAFYVGAVPGSTVGGTFAAYDQEADRRFFVQALGLALRYDRIP